jgi:hypothetical protein
MHQVMWETVFNKQFEELIESYGLDKSDRERIESLRQNLNFSSRSSCKLMIEVEEDWKEKLIQILEAESGKKQITNH